MGNKIFPLIFFFGIISALQGTILSPVVAAMSPITAASMGLVAGYLTGQLRVLNPGAFWRHTILCGVIGFAGWAVYALIFL